MSLIRVARNGIYMVGSGAGGALLAVVLPPFLVRWLPPQTYGAWILLLQLAAYFNLLRFGVATVLGRLIAVAEARGDGSLADRALSTAFALLSASTLVALMGVGLVANNLERWFPQMPPAMLPDARVGLWIMGVVLACSLPFSALTGAFLGLQRYAIPALLNLSSKGLSAILLVIFAYSGRTHLAQLSVAWAVGMVALAVGQWICWRRVQPTSHPRWACLDWSLVREMARDCSSLTVWSLSMLLVSGLDVALVGHFQFQALVYYGLAASVITLVDGAQNALFSPLVPVAAQFREQADGATALAALLIRSSRYGMYLLLALGVPLLVFGKLFLTVWLGAAYAASTLEFFRILLAANIFRLVAAPYCALLVGTGQQHRVLASPLLEGLTNLGASLWWGARWGAVGVAWGTMAGAVVGIGCHVVYNLPRTQAIACTTRHYVQRGVLQPALPFLPLVGAAGLIRLWSATVPLQVLLLLVSASVSASWLWMWGLDSAERARVRRGWESLLRQS